MTRIAMERNIKRKKHDFGFEKERTKRAIKNLSWKVATRLTDLVFLQLVFFSGFVARGRYAQKGLLSIFKQYRGIDWEKVRRALGYLKQKGLVEYTKGKFLEPTITEQGRKRYKSLFPSYDEKRVWDKKVYLITYDIPEEKRRDRDKLRDFLQRIGCGRLQASVWLTCYNPKKLVEEYVNNNYIHGSVIVSDIGKDGSVGGEDLRSLVARVFKLERLNKRHKKFITNVKEGKIEKHQIGFAFMAVLMEDPQLPFELLPDDWLGERAYKIFLKYCRF